MRERVGSILAGVALLVIVALQPSFAAAEDKIIENVFASVTLDGKKIGQIHFTLTSKPTGEVEELRTNASVSVLGIKLYSFSQHLHETWRNGTLQTLRSDADDNGKDEKVRVKRTGNDFEAVRNDKPADLQIMNITVTRKAETVDYLGKATPAERFDFAGDWHATLWFGKDQRLLKAHRMVGDREIVITIDSD